LITWPKDVKSYDKVTASTLTNEAQNCRQPLGQEEKEGKWEEEEA